MFDFLRKKSAPAPAAGRLPVAKDDYDRAILGDIARVGWSVIQINADEQSPVVYSFSVGLTHTHQHPEIILLGLPHKVAGTIINGIGVTIAAGGQIEPGRKYADFTSIPVIFAEVPPAHFPECVGYALWLYRGPNFRLLQCVWPLKSGHFPWDAGYDKRGAEIQPFLGNVK